MESKKVFLFLLAVSLGCFSAGKEKPEEKADLNALVKAPHHRTGTSLG